MRVRTLKCSLVGLLSSVDGYMNIALEKTEEYIDGELKKAYGDAFVRGNNGMIRCHSVWISTTILICRKSSIFPQTDCVPVVG